jgi:H/ACA ribonucleoprotein complex non-core subunit NAF1
VRLCDLPPVEEDLNLTVAEAEVLKIGTVSSCVEELVVIESLPGNPALDLDSVLFLDRGQRALGRVFDVIGPVARPFYCVRFNSATHIKQRGVERGMDVFFAPRTEHTTFVFLEQLMKMKIRSVTVGSKRLSRQVLGMMKHIG